MKRTVTHEIKLEKSVKFILLAFAIAIFTNAFDVSSPIKDAFASAAVHKIAICDQSGQHCASIRSEKISDKYPRTFHLRVSTDVGGVLPNK